MKKVLFLFLVTLAVNLGVNAEEGKEEKSLKTSFEVMVIDAETEEPIPAAKIKIGKNEQEAYTDFDGFAQFDELTKGIYDIEISFISYKKQQLKAFQLDNSSNKLLIKLQP